MASSDQGPSGSNGFGDFLGSPPNLVGLAVFAVIFLALVVFAGSPVAAVLAGLLGYGAAFLLTPSDPRPVRRYPSGIPVAGASRQEMTERLDEFQSRVRGARAKLPPGAEDRLRHIVHRMREIVVRWEDVAPATEQRMALESIAYQYLPNTLEVFLRLPDSEKPAHAREWLDQLETLDTEVDRSRRAVVRHDIEAMRANGRMLEQKFEDGDLKMFRDNGL